MKRIPLFLLICFIVLFSAQVAEAQATLYRLPLASNPGYNAWYDHDSSGSKLRYDCVTNFSYNGHHGTDFATSMGTSVYAGATGSLYYRVDGCPDGSSPSCGGGYGNHVRIQHPMDGEVSIYAHLKNGTPISTQYVSCSTYVGQSGNSGTSSGAHLHFEIWRNSGIGARLDPFIGSCNYAPPTYWVNQNGGWPTTTCQ